MRRILYISGTRADYGLMRQALFRIRKHSGLEIEIVATGMHLMSKFGKTVNEIKKDKFKIHQINSIYRFDNKESMANFIGKFILRLTGRIRQIKPDIILILGDRAEMLAAAIVGTYLTIPVVHIHGGDVSSTVDEVVRHAITKLSHFHLAVTSNSAKRLIRMGEDSWRVDVVGAPGLDNILHGNLLSKTKIAAKYNLDLSNPVILVIQHPVIDEICDIEKQITETIEAIKKLNHQSIVIYPNADAGGRKIIKIIERYRKYPFIHIYKNISYNDYLSIMRLATVLVGNSSSGIIEAPSFFLPVVNIGTRQAGRERARNIIEVNYDRKEIIAAIEKVICDREFKQKVKQCKNPYGDGKTSERIVKALTKLKINKKLLYKKITY